MVDPKKMQIAAPTIIVKEAVLNDSLQKKMDDLQAKKNKLAQLQVSTSFDALLFLLIK